MFLAGVAPPDPPTSSRLGLLVPEGRGGLPATGGGWIEGRAPHLGWLLVVRRCALIDAGRTAFSVSVVRRREMKLMTATALSVLLVEDEIMIRMMIAEMLEELGHRVAAETGEIDQAIRLAQNTEFDLAILDVNVQGKLITPVAELITTLNRPIIFRPAMARPAFQRNFGAVPASKNPFWSKHWPGQST